MKNVSNDNKGFTLIELIIYLGITAVALLVFTNFMVDVTHNASKSRISKEVHQNARIILTKITQDIRTSQGIDAATSILNSDDGRLVILRPAGSSTYDLSGEDVTYNDGSGSQILTTGFVKVTKLNFTEVGDAVSVNITVEQRRDSAPGHDRDSITLSSTIVPRSAVY